MIRSQRPQCLAIMRCSLPYATLYICWPFIIFSSFCTEGFGRYGGIFERGSHEYTLDEFYSIQLDKMDRFVCMKKSDIAIREDEESSSDGGDDGGRNGGTGEDDDDDDDGDGVELDEETT